MGLCVLPGFFRQMGRALFGSLMVIGLDTKLRRGEINIFVGRARCHFSSNKSFVSK